MRRLFVYLNQDDRFQKQGENFFKNIFYFGFVAVIRFKYSLRSQSIHNHRVNNYYTKTYAASLR